MSFLSVVICTLNRAEGLHDILRRLAGQTFPKNRFEVVVVDDGSTDHTPEMIATFLESATLPLKYLRHERRGPGFTQNRGIREALGPLVLLLCDDMQPQPDLLAVHVRYHEQHPEPNVAVTGKILQSPDLPDTVFLRNWEPFRWSRLASGDELTHLCFCGCHVSFKKEFMVQYGMFLERTTPAHEDVEAGWRMCRDGGMRLLYRPDAVTYHNHVETIESACRRASERGRNFDVLTDLVPDPGVYIKYHLVTRNTISIIRRGFRSRGSVLMAEDRNVLKYFAREALRRLVFNRLTVPGLFLPLIRRAEDNRLLARLVSPLMIRGVVSFHFLQGYRERHAR